MEQEGNTTPQRQIDNAHNTEVSDLALEDEYFDNDLVDWCFLRMNSTSGVDSSRKKTTTAEMLSSVRNIKHFHVHQYRTNLQHVPDNATRSISFRSESFPW